LAGYTLDNFTTLLTDLRAQILNQDATALETTSYFSCLRLYRQMTLSSQVISVSTSGVSADAFTVPSGFKKIETKTQ